MTPDSLRPRLRRYLPEGGGGLLGLALGLLFLYLRSPVNFLSEVVIVSGPQCQKSEKLVKSIVAHADLQRVFTPLSVNEDDEDPSVTEICEVGYQAVLTHAPWFRLAGREWVCGRLKEAATRYHERAHGMLPVWVHGGRIVDVAERDRLLSAAGYYLLPGGDGVVLRTEISDSAANDAARAPPPGSLTEWRGQSIGF